MIFAGAFLRGDVHRAAAGCDRAGAAGTAAGHESRQGRLQRGIGLLCGAQVAGLQRLAQLREFLLRNARAVRAGVHVVKVRVPGAQVLLKVGVIRLRRGKISGLQILRNLVEALRKASGGGGTGRGR